MLKVMSHELILMALVLTDVSCGLKVSSSGSADRIDRKPAGTAATSEKEISGKSSGNQEKSQKEPEKQNSVLMSNPNSQPTNDGNLPAPVIQNIRVSFPGGRLSPQSLIAVDFEVLNLTSLDTTTVFWRKPAGAWEEVKDTAVTPTGVSFVYGTRNVGPFEIKVISTQKNSSASASEMSTLWQPSLFQTAILTRGSACGFCHIHVEGDVGVIDFPNVMQVSAGSGSKITGSLFTTNAVPEQIKGRATGGELENYKNTDKNIFPENLRFPALTSEKIQPKVQGSLKGGKLTTGGGPEATVVKEVLKSFKGNLILDGKDSPLILSGEVFVDGDVVIRGKYQGIGTIYAKNIFVADNLIANSSPFPYPTNELDAVAKAKSEMGKGTDALYLAAFQDVVVGDVDHGFQGNESIGRITTNTPYTWLDKDKYLTLGTRRLVKSDYKMANGGPATWDPNDTYITTINNRRTDKPGFMIDVARVDAYIYGGRSFIWESFSNSLLNGGYMSPTSLVLSILQFKTGSFWNCSTPKSDARESIPDGCGKFEALVNPVNGLPTHTNVIRYDYRLAAGIAGLDSLKALMAP